MKRFGVGLVVGKFAPLHRGHEVLIGAAFEQCERVLIISYSLPELPGCEPDKRKRWLQTRFPTAEICVVSAEHSAEAYGLVMPPNDGAADAHRHFVATLCLRVFKTPVDAVFTAEDYGDGFAAVLTQRFSQQTGARKPVVHVKLDRNHGPVAVSGTLIRSDIHRYRHWVAPCVYADFVQRICLLGGESTGKSTLTVALAHALNTAYVAEYGRTLWEQKHGALVYDDLLHIARTQIAHEDAAAANRYLVCDTSPLTTLFYSEHLFGKADPALHELAQRSYAITVLCAPDFPFVQDGTRQDETFRLRQHAWYQAELKRRNIRYVVATGSVAARVQHILAFDSAD